MDMDLDFEIQRFIGEPADVQGLLTAHRPKAMQNAVRLAVRALLKTDSGIERAKTLTELHERGMTFGDDCIGFHGTSIESVIDLLANGALRGRTHVDVPKIQKRGDLHIYVRKNKWNGESKVHSFYSDSEIEDEAGIYARNCGSRHFLQKMLGFSRPATAADFLDYLREDFTPEGYREFDDILRAQGRTKTELMPLSHRALQRKGVILGISTEVVKSHALVPGDDWDEGDYALRGGPVSLANVCSIKGCGKEENDLLNIIRKEYGKVSKT